MEMILSKTLLNKGEGYCIKNINYCCNKIKNNYMVAYKIFSDKPRVTIFETAISDGEVKKYYQPITFCPFCGSKINICVDEIVDKKNEEKKLVERLEYLNKKIAPLIKEKHSLELDLQDLYEVDEWEYIDNMETNYMKSSEN